MIDHGEWAVEPVWVPGTTGRAILWRGLTRVAEKNLCQCSRDWWATAGPSHPDSKPDPHPLLLQFAVFLSLITLVEVAAAIAGYVFRDRVSGA